MIDLPLFFIPSTDDIVVINKTLVVFMTTERHLMNGDTVSEYLELLQPHSEDWHALMNFMLVRYKQ